jgi:hypothetical protein
MKAVSDYILKFWPIITLCLSAVFFSGGAWSDIQSVKQSIADMKPKVEKVAGMEVSIQYMQQDISEIKDIIKGYVKNQK